MLCFDVKCQRGCYKQVGLCSLGVGTLFKDLGFPTPTGLLAGGGGDGPGIQCPESPILWSHKCGRSGHWIPGPSPPPRPSLKVQARAIIGQGGTGGAAGIHARHTIQVRLFEV